jgi:hypothetical protein
LPEKGRKRATLADVDVIRRRRAADDDVTAFFLRRLAET